MPAATAVAAGLEYVATVTLIVADIARSTAFYRDVERRALSRSPLAVGFVVRS